VYVGVVGQRRHSIALTERLVAWLVVRLGAVYLPSCVRSCQHTTQRPLLLHLWLNGARMARELLDCGLAGRLGWLAGWLVGCLGALVGWCDDAPSEK
jgi:hypothetical protein